MRDIALPQLNANDATCVLVEWRFGDGDAVPADAVVAVIETSKAVEELPVSTGGVLHRLVTEGDECGFGDVIGHLFGGEEERQRFLAGRGRPTTPDPDVVVPDAVATDVVVPDVVVTEPARELAAELGIDEGRLRALGRAVVKREHVAALASDRDHGDGERRPGLVRPDLARRQQAVADVVTRAHQTIPAAFTVVKVLAEAALAGQRATAQAGQDPGGVPAGLIRAVAGLVDKFPACYGTSGGKPPEHAHVAVTVDAGNGLFLPVMHTADAMSLDHITALLREFHQKAVSGTFTAADLAGANVAVSLSNYSDIIMTQPIIFPGHSCILSLGSLQRELYLSRAGAVASRSYFLLGAAYDHRTINGRDAVLFLRAVKASLENRATWSG